MVRLDGGGVADGDLARYLVVPVALRRALLAAVRCRFHSLPSSVSRCKHLEQSGAWGPVTRRPQAAHGSTGGIFPASRSRRRRWRSAAVGSGMNRHSSISSKISGPLFVGAVVLMLESCRGLVEGGGRRDQSNDPKEA